MNHIVSKTVKGKEERSKVGRIGRVGRDEMEGGCEEQDITIFLKQYLKTTLTMFKKNKKLNFK